MKFEDLLKEIGDEHRYQILMTVFLLIPTSFFNSFFEGLFLFSLPDHWCRVPELEHLPISLQHHLIRPPLEDGKWSNCERYDIDEYLNENGSILFNMTYIGVDSKILTEEHLDSLNDLLKNWTKPNASMATTNCSYGWIYDQSLYAETASTWFNFVCDRGYYINLIMSFTSVGLALMTPLLSNLSDRIGRRKALLYTLIIAELSCLSPLVLKDIYSFIVARFLSGGVINALFQLPFVMTQELASQRYRTRASCISAIFYSLGACFVTLAIKLAGNWVTFTWIQFTLTTSFLLAYKWIPESPSWLISKKKYEPAYKQLVRICHVNKRKVPENLMQSIMSLEQEDDEKSDDSFTDLLLRPGLRSKTLIITFVYIACIIGYGGIVVNTTNLEANNQLYNYLLLSFIDLPSSFVFWWLITTRLGRRWINVMTLGLCGISLMLPALHPTYEPTFYLICTLFGKFGVAGTFMVIYQHASELYPTTLRNQGIGITATIGSIGGVLVPQIVYLNKLGAWIPLFTIGIICTLAAIVASFLPETLNEYLPQRAKQSAEFGRDRPYWCLARPKLVHTKEDEQNVLSTSDRIPSAETSTNGHSNGNAMEMQDTVKL